MGRKSEVSAGLLVYRDLEVLLAHPGGPYWAKKDAGAWTIPKGVVEPGDNLLATAQREFTEETSFEASGPFVALSSVRQKSGKTVHAFACAGDFDAATFVSGTFEIEWPPRSRRMQTFPEIDRLGWFTLPAAREKILPYQLPFLDEFEEIARRVG